VLHNLGQHGRGDQISNQKTPSTFLMGSDCFYCLHRISLPFPDNVRLSSLSIVPTSEESQLHFQLSSILIPVSSCRARRQTVNKATIEEIIYLSLLYSLTSILTSTGTFHPQPFVLFVTPLKTKLLSLKSFQPTSQSPKNPSFESSPSAQTDIMRVSHQLSSCQVPCMLI
jgi:hypothetical protein